MGKSKAQPVSDKSLWHKSLPPLLSLELPFLVGMGCCLCSLSPGGTKDSRNGEKNSGATISSKVENGGSGMNQEELQRVPGRMFSNGASERACLFTHQGKKGTNQDAMLVWEDFASRDDTVFCGVFDGHGPYGHMVAKKVRDTLPLNLSNQWRDITNGNGDPHQNGTVGGSIYSKGTASISLDIDQEWIDPLDSSASEKFPETYLILRQSLLKAFKLMDKELKLDPALDCFCSGTTAVALVKQGQDLVIGNVGDSRAVLATRYRDNSLVPIQLTVDLKPNLPREAARIQQCKGRVFALQDEPEVARVWLPNNDSPGLAMARAFGDFCLKEYGLISVPDVTYRRLSDRDEFVVLATDGVWDVFSNKEVVDIIASAPTRGTAARALVDCAVRAWRLKFPTSKSDDCAAICLFLNPSSSDQDQNHQKIPDADAQEVGASVSNCSQPQNSSLQNVYIASGVDDIVPESEARDEKLPNRCQSTRSLADCISTAEEEEWSALEGVTRVNSLLNLPRFLSAENRSTMRRKWL